MIRFVHTADIHFGVENYGRIDPQKGIHTRLLDFHKAFNLCIDRAISEKVDFFLFAGDAYKTAHPTPTQQRLLTESFLRLFHAQIPIVMIIGNHDNALSFGKAHALEIFGQIPVQGMHVIARPTTLCLATKSGPIQIVGIPWPSRTTIALQGAYACHSGDELAQVMSESLAMLIAQHAATLDPSIPALLAGHLTVSSGIFSGSEKRAVTGSDPLFLVSQLALKPFDYVALGHLHRYQNLNQNNHPAVVYSGSVEKIDFGERADEKGFCLVTIHDKEHTSHAFIPLPTRPFIQIDVQIDHQVDQTATILTAMQKHTLTDAVVKIVYHLSKGVKDLVDKGKIQQACSSAHHLAGIFAVRQIPPSQPRMTRVSTDMDLATLLAYYFKTKPELLPHSERLIKKVLQLAEEQEYGKRINEL